MMIMILILSIIQKEMEKNAFNFLKKKMKYFFQFNIYQMNKKIILIYTIYNLGKIIILKLKKIKL